MASDATYDVFLSYATRDKPAVEELARRLKDAGVKPFLDKWHLVPGEPWQEALEVALDRSQTCAVFLGPGHLGPWQNEEMRAALERRVRDKSHRVIPVLLPGASDPTKKALPPGLKQLTWVEFRGGLHDPHAFHRLLCGIRGTQPENGPVGVEPTSPLGRSEARRVKWPRRRVLLLLASAALFVVLGTLGLFLILSISRWLGRQSPGIAESVREACAHGEASNEAGIVFVRICPGNFRMGSIESDQAEVNERPAHRVTLSEFWLGKTEVTNKQYRLFQPNHQGEDELPATGVSWAEAKAACQHFGGRLPTEA